MKRAVQQIPRPRNFVGGFPPAANQPPPEKSVPVPRKFLDNDDLDHLMKEENEQGVLRHILKDDFQKVAIQLFEGKESVKPKKDTPRNIPGRSRANPKAPLLSQSPIVEPWIRNIWNDVKNANKNLEKELENLLSENKIGLEDHYTHFFPMKSSLPSLCEQYFHLTEKSERYLKRPGEKGKSAASFYSGSINPEIIEFLDFMTSLQSEVDQIKRDYEIGKLEYIYENAVNEGLLADQRKTGLCIRQKGNISDYVSSNIEVRFPRHSGNPEAARVLNISAANLKFDSKEKKGKGKGKEKEGDQETGGFKKEYLQIGNPNSILDAMAPLLKTLMETIRELDDRDGPHLKKHVIFTDVAKFGYGAKLIGSVFDANGYHYRKFTGMSFSDILYQGGVKKVHAAKIVDLKKKDDRSFALLTTAEIFQDNIADYKVNALTKIYNSRGTEDNPIQKGLNNLDGDLIRYMIIDSKYKEGIDLYDVTYFHVLGDLMTHADETQAIGRALRRCGQAGLRFDAGWQLKVFLYLNRLHIQGIHSIKESVMKHYPIIFEFVDLVDVFENWA